MLLGVVAAITSIKPALAEGREVLAFESSIPLPDSPTHEVAWTQDGKKLAMRGFNSGAINIIDLETRSVSPPVAEHIKGGAKLRFSPDGAFLAVYSGLGLQLLSTNDWKLVAQLDFSYLRGLKGTGDMAFTTEGHTLWMACGRSARGPEKADALSFNIPDLKFIGAFESVGRIRHPGYRARENDTVFRNHFGLIDGRSALTSVVHHWTGNKTANGEDESTSYVRSVFLGDSGPVSEEVEFVSANLTQDGGEIGIAMRGREAIVTTYGNANDPDTAPQFLNFNPDTGALKTRFGSIAESK